MNTVEDIKRVGSSGQISLGKHLAGRYFREEVQADGAIHLIPVAVLATTHWTVRDHQRIVNALEWAGRTAPKETDLAALEKRASSRQRRGR